MDDTGSTTRLFLLKRWCFRYCSSRALMSSLMRRTSAHAAALALWLLAAAPSVSLSVTLLMLPHVPVSFLALSLPLQHCAWPDCGQLDFLPFKCGCGQTFCLEHRTAAAHKCRLAGESKQVIVCPICAQVCACFCVQQQTWCLQIMHGG